MSKENCVEEFNTHYESLPYAHSFLRVPATLRKEDCHFRVYEHLSFELTGEGEHLFLLIEKEGCNTEWVAKQLIKRFEVDSKALGYAGKKDRHSVSQQWFSVQLPGINLENEEIVKIVNNEEFKLIKAARHNKKLRRGAISFNHFEITLSDINSEFDSEAFEKLSREGFPNYFGYQRFGIDSSNLVKADRLLTGQTKIKSREKRSMAISAARSFLFNLQLAKRLTEENWNQAVEGDCFNLDGSNSFFSVSKNHKADEKTDFASDKHDLDKRLAQGDIHVSGWLPGNQPSEASAVAQDYEQLANKAYNDWFDGFSKLRVDSSRRAFRVIPKNLHCEKEEELLHLQFDLPSGSYATSLLREMFDVTDASVEKAKAYIAEKERERAENVD